MGFEIYGVQQQLPAIKYRINRKAKPAYTAVLGKATIFTMDANNDSPQCGICLENTTDNILLQCQHLYCNTCMREWAKTCVFEGGDLEVTCPHPPCRKPLSETYVYRLLATDRNCGDLYDTLIRFKENRRIESDPNSRWCPTRNCSAVISRHVYLVCFVEKFVTCPDCRNECCFECGLSHGSSDKCHVNDGDAQVLKSLLSERGVDAGKQYKKCPKCSKLVSKLDGCNHITCACAYEWCWICGGRYSRYHYKSYNLCGCPGLHFASGIQGIRSTSFFYRILVRFAISSLSMLLLVLLVIIQVLIGFPLAILSMCGVWFCAFLGFHRKQSMFLTIATLFSTFLYRNMINGQSDIHSIGCLEGII